MAAAASDNHTKLVNLKADLMILAKRAEDAADDPEKLEKLRRDLLANARMYGVIGEEERFPCE